MDISHGVTCTLRAEAHHPPVVLEEMSVFENHSQDTRYTGPVNTAPTVAATYGTGGNNQPFVVRDEVAKVFGICSRDSNAMKSCNPHTGFYEATTTRTIDANGGNPTCNQGGVAIVENKTYCASKASFFMKADEEIAATLCASDYKDPPLINGNDTPQYSLPPNAPVSRVSRIGGAMIWAQTIRPKRRLLSGLRFGKPTAGSSLQVPKPGAGIRSSSGSRIHIPMQLSIKCGAMVWLCPVYSLFWPELCFVHKMRNCNSTVSG